MNNFKKALINTLLVCCFIIIILFVFLTPYFESETYYYQDFKVRKNLAGKLDTLALGSSHALRSIKPVIINEQLDAKSYNLSSPLMSMYGRYTLLKKEIERNPIKTVYFEISFNALTLDRKYLGSEGDIYVLGRLDNPIERINFYKNAFSKDEYQKIASDTIKRSLYSIKNINHNETIIQNETYGYLPCESVDQTLKPETKKAIINTEIIDSQIKEDNLNYFNKIVKLCKDNNIRLILVVTPVTEQMILKNSNMDEVFSQYVELAQRNKIEYYDFNLDKERNKLYSEKDSYYDTLHMSDSGADIFTMRLIEIINKVNNGEDVSNNFYTSYDELKNIILKQK